MNPSLTDKGDVDAKVYQRGITIESQHHDWNPRGVASVSKGNHD